jgi:hypothetical protein
LSSTSNSETESSPREFTLDATTLEFPLPEKVSSKDAETTIRRRLKLTRLAKESPPRDNPLVPEKLTLLRVTLSSNTPKLSENSGKTEDEEPKRSRRMAIVDFYKIYIHCFLLIS